MQSLLLKYKDLGAMFVDCCCTSSLYSPAFFVQLPLGYTQLYVHILYSTVHNNHSMSNHNLYILQNCPLDAARNFLQSKLQQETLRSRGKYDTKAGF